MPPQTGAMSFTVRMISSVSVVSRHTGHASTPVSRRAFSGWAAMSRHTRATPGV